MAELPATVLHGTAMWILLATWSAASAALAAWAARRRRVRSEAAARRDRLGRPASGLDDHRPGEPVTLAGRLELAGAACRDFEDGRPVAAASATPAGGRNAADAVHARGDELVLAVGRLRVRLDGPLQVTVGSRESRPLLPLRWHGPGPLERLAAAANDDEALARLARTRVAYRSLDPGDTIRVRGLPTGGPAEGWRLVGEGGDPLRAAYEGAPRPGRAVRTLAAPLAWGLLAAAAASCALVAAGDAALAAWNPPPHAAEPPRVCPAPPRSPLDSIALQIAALSPAHRPETLDLLYEELARSLADCPGNPRLMDELEALGDRLGRCRRTTELLARHGTPARAAEAGARCGDPESLWTAGDAALRGGDPDAASALFERLPGGQGRSQAWQLVRPIQAHLAAGRLDLAARALRELAEALHRRPPSRRPPRARRAQLECLALALEARRGAPAAEAELRQAMRGPATAFCGLLLADLLDGPDRLAALEEVRSASPGPLEARLADLLELEVSPAAAGPRDPERDPFERRLDDVLQDASAAAAAGGAGALARHAADVLRAATAERPRTTDERLALAGLELEAAGFAAAVGELGEARRRLSDARGDLEAPAAGRPAGEAMAGETTAEGPDAHGPATSPAGLRDVLTVRLAAIELMAWEDGRAEALLAAPPSLPSSPAAGDPWLAPLRALLDARRAGTLGPLRNAVVPDPVLAEVWRRAAAGDGAGLVEAVDRPRSGVPPPLLVPVVALLRDGRATLLDLLRAAVPAPCAAGVAAESLGRAAACHAACGRLARALGDAATAERYERIAQRLRAPLLDRARIVPLLLLEAW